MSINSWFSVVLPAALIAMLSGCSKEPPKCSDEGTIRLVRQIIVGNIGGLKGATEDEINQSLVFEFPRATAYDEKIRKYSCSAKLLAGGMPGVEIIYESQLDDTGQHIVGVGGLGMADYMALDLILTEGLKKQRGRENMQRSPAQNRAPAPSGTDCVDKEFSVWERKRDAEIRQWCDELSKKGEECRISAGQEEAAKQDALDKIRKKCGG